MGISRAWQAGQRWSQTSFIPILVLALFLRVAWAVAVPVSPVSDGYVYDWLARSLAHGIGYCWTPGNPTAYWPVGTSFIYSVLYRAFGVSYLPVIVFNISISLGTIWLSMRLAERWFNRTIAIFAGYVFACWPVQIEFTTVIASEPLFNFFMAALLVIWDSPRLNPWLKALLVGLLAAATCYIRPIALLLPAVLFANTISRERKFAMPAATAAVAYIVMALAIAPWCIRNTRIFGHFVLISTNGGSNFWMGNNPDGPGGTEDIPAYTLNMQEAERDNYLGSIAKAYIREYPGRFIVRTLWKVVWIHDHETIGVHWNLSALQRVYGARTVWVLKLISDLYWWAVLPLALAGAMLLIVQRGAGVILTSPPIILWAYFTALHAVIVAQDRYHYPCLPFIGILAAYALCTIWKRIVALQTKRHAQRLPVVS